MSILSNSMRPIANGEHNRLSIMLSSNNDNEHCGRCLSLSQYYLHQRLRSDYSILCRQFVQTSLFAYVVFICVSRVLTNSHHPSDVVGGAVIGVCTSICEFTQQYISLCTGLRKSVWISILIGLIILKISDCILQADRWLRPERSTRSRRKR